MTVPLEYFEPGYQERIEQLRHEARERQEPPQKAWTCALVALAIGVVGFLIGVFYAPGRAWGAMDANFLFWSAIAQGGIVAGAVFNTGWARWGRNVQRIIEALGAFVPFLPLVYLILWAGRWHVFKWIYMTNRSPWLIGYDMLWRDELVLIVVGGLGLWWLYHSLRPDVGVMLRLDEGRGVSSPPTNDPLLRWLVRRWRGQGREVSWSQAVLRNLGPGFISAYVWGYSMLNIDLAMSVDPKFKSTMYPGIYWVSAYLAPISLGTILLWLWRKWSPAFRDLVTTSNVQDLANLVWAFAIFRTWFDWSQYIIIWFGNLPDEAIWVLERWRTRPWNWLAYLSLWFEFIAPFFSGMSRRLKRNPATAAILGGMVFVGVLSRLFTDVMPGVVSLGPQDFGLIEAAVTVGFAGAVFLPYLWLIRRVPLFPISDPLWHDALETRGIPET